MRNESAQQSWIIEERNETPFSFCFVFFRCSLYAVVVALFMLSWWVYIHRTGEVNCVYLFIMCSMWRMDDEPFVSFWHPRRALHIIQAKQWRLLFKSPWNFFKKRFTAYFEWIKQSTELFCSPVFWVHDCIHWCRGNTKRDNFNICLWRKFIFFSPLWNVCVWQETSNYRFRVWTVEKFLLSERLMHFKTLQRRDRGKKKSDAQHCIFERVKLCDDEMWTEIAFVGRQWRASIVREATRRGDL